jgi:hypothetical protein
MKLKLPTSWDAVTLAEWQAIRKILSEDEDPYLTECAIISTLSGADMDVIMSISRHEHGHIMCHTLKFLNTVPNGKLKTRVKVGGKWYRIESQAKDITGGQYIDMNHFIKDVDKVDFNLHNVIACLATPLKWGFIKQPYNGKEHENVAKAMLGLPITTVKPLADFFLQNYVDLMKNIAAYLMRTGTEMKTKALAQLANSSKSTDGSTQFTSSRMAGASSGTSI